MKDYLVRMMAAEGTVRGFAATTRELSEEARRIHGTSPVATAALGRLLTAGAMMGVQLKDEKDLLTLSIRGDGPLGGVTVTADMHGRVKGFVNNPEVWIPPKYAGKLDVGGAVGAGTLTVTRDQAYGQPYSSQVALQTGEIGDDLAAYFVLSEQLPSSVGLGVLVDNDGEDGFCVKKAGGFLIQVMPGCSEETITTLEENLKKVPSVTAALSEGKTPEDLLNILLGGLSPAQEGTEELSYFCKCSRERVSRVLISLGQKELRSLLEEGQPVELCCHFCGKKYEFSIDEIRISSFLTQPDFLYGEQNRYFHQRT